MVINCHKNCYKNYFTSGNYNLCSTVIQLLNKCYLFRRAPRMRRKKTVIYPDRKPHEWKESAWNCSCWRNMRQSSKSGTCTYIVWNKLYRTKRQRGKNKVLCMRVCQKTAFQTNGAHYWNNRSFSSGIDLYCLLFQFNLWTLSTQDLWAISPMRSWNVNEA